MNEGQYVHGYSIKESNRLNDQADTLDSLLHYDTVFPPGSHILEAGCGVGAQTKIITIKNPGSRFISIDQSQNSIDEAEKTIQSLNINNVEFQKADIYSLPYENEIFDFVFVCFVLEHLSNPLKALEEIKRVLKKDGILMVIEGDHGSTFFYPDSQEAHKAIECQIKLQKQNGGNSNIGREIYPLLKTSGFRDISVSPRMVYVDESKPNLVEGFIKNTFTSMIEGVEENAVRQGIINKDVFIEGKKGLYRTMEPGGVFCYTFFKGTGRK